MIKNFTLAVLGCLLFAGSSIAAPKRNPQAQRAQFSSEKIIPGGELIVNGKTFKIKGESARRSTATRAVADVITTAPGTPREYTKESGGYYNYGSIAAYQDWGQASKIVWDGNDAYFYNILSYKETFSYVLGFREGDEIQVPMGQSVDAGDDFDVCIGLLRTMIWTEKNPNWEEEDGDYGREVNYINFIVDESMDEVSYYIMEDGSIILDLPEVNENSVPLPDYGVEYLNPEDYGFPDYVIGFYYSDDLGWTGDADLYQLYEEFNYEKVEVPENVEFEYYSYLNSGNQGVLVNVGRVDDTLYIKGLSMYAPDAVFKAKIIETENGYKASIAQDQFIGMDMYGYYNLITKALVYDPSINDFDFGIPGTVATFSLSMDETGQIVSMSTDDDSILVFNYASELYDPYDEFMNITLRYQATLEGTPCTPYNVWYEEHDDWLGANYLIFHMNEISEDGLILDVNEIYFRVYVNGELFEFQQHDGMDLKDDFVTMYAGVYQPTTMIPYLFDNGFDLFSFEDEFYVGFYTWDVETVGVQAIYTYGDEETYSELVTVSAKEDDSVESFNAEVISTQYYDLSGKMVTNPQGGIFIKRSVMSDGSVKVSKVAKR